MCFLPTILQLVSSINASIDNFKRSDQNIFLFVPGISSPKVRTSGVMEKKLIHFEVQAYIFLQVHE